MLHETIIKKYPWAQFIHFNKNVFVMFFLFFFVRYLLTIKMFVTHKQCHDTTYTFSFIWEMFLVSDFFCGSDPRFFFLLPSNQ